MGTNGFGWWHLKRAAEILRAGGIVAYPTEGVYGLGCDPDDADAVRRLLRLKRRPERKGLILIGAALEHLRPYLREPEPAVMERVLASWPGPVTWLMPARETTPRWLTGGSQRIAVRVTAHPLAAALCRRYGGALVSTSANVGGRPAARDALGVRRCLGGQVDFVLPGAVGGAPGPSEIRDALTERVVRPAAAARAC